MIQDARYTIKNANIMDHESCIMNPAQICVIIPAFNAGDTVGEIIKGCKRYIRDVIVVDDGSEDNTSLISYAEGALVLRHEKNRGKGIALKTGFSYASSSGFDAVITIDADGQHDPSDIPLFIEKYLKDGHHIIIGNRMLEKGKIPKYRYYTNLVGIYFISKAAGHALEDSQSGFRLYRKEVIKEISLESGGFETETEILIKAGRRGYKITSVPVGVSYKNGGSHYRPFRDTYRISLIVLKSIFW